MPWPCYMVEKLKDRMFRLASGEIVTWSQLAPGAMWVEKWSDEPDHLVVKLPGGCAGNEWDIDKGRLLNAAKAGRSLPAWTRTGDPPNVTVTPSINWVGMYHGHLQNGTLTDDCEGRKLNEG